MSDVKNYAASLTIDGARVTPFTVYSNSEQAEAEAFPDEEAIKLHGEPRDREIAGALLRALHDLQEALDAAALAGLIIQPTFKKYGGRFKDRGSDADSYVAMVEVYRKIA